MLVVVPEGHVSPLSAVPPHLPAMQPPTTRQGLPHAPQLATSVCSSTHAPLQEVCPGGQQFPFEAASPLGQTHAPLWQTAPLAQALPQPPQWSGSVSGSTQAWPHLSAHVHVPAVHTSPAPAVVAHHSSTAGSLSTMPSQSLSSPSHTSGADVHLQISLGWPSSDPHVQPGTHEVADVHVVVQTSPGPVGRQMPLGQSELVAHGTPADPVRASTQTPVEQLRPGAHASFSQHASPAAPQPIPMAASFAGLASFLRLASTCVDESAHELPVQSPPSRGPTLAWPDEHPVATTIASNVAKQKRACLMHVSGRAGAAS